jgi:hypothetical protein
LLVGLGVLIYLATPIRPRPADIAATPTYAIVLTVLPASTAAPGAPVSPSLSTSPTPEPTETLPSAIATRLPTLAPTATVTSTPEPTRKPLEEMRQRG